MKTKEYEPPILLDVFDHGATKECAQMKNFPILCHDELKEFSSFEIAQDQNVIHRGDFGSLLFGGTARQGKREIRDNATFAASGSRHQGPRSCRLPPALDS